MYKRWINDKLNNGGKKRRALLSSGTLTLECRGVYPGGSPWLHSLQTQSGFNGGVRWGSTNQPSSSPLTPPSERRPLENFDVSSRSYNIIQFLPAGWGGGDVGAEEEVQQELVREKEKERKKGGGKWGREGDLRCAFDKIFKCLCPSASHWCCEIVSPSGMDKGSLWASLDWPLSLKSCHIFEGFPRTRQLRRCVMVSLKRRRSIFNEYLSLKRNNNYSAKLLELILMLSHEIFMCSREKGGYKGGAGCLRKSVLLRLSLFLPPHLRSVYVYVYMCV